MEHGIAGVVDPARQPLLDFVLVVSVIVAQVDAGHAAWPMLDSGWLVLVDVGVDEAEEGAFHQAHVEPQLHAGFLLLGGPAIVGLRRSVVSNHIGVAQRVGDVLVRRATLDHQAPEDGADHADGPLYNRILIVPVPGAELVLHPLVPAVLDESLGGVDELVVRPDEGHLGWVMAVFEAKLQLLPHGQGLVLALGHHIQVADAVVAVHVHLEGVASLREGHVNVDAVVHRFGAGIMVLAQRSRLLLADGADPAVRVWSRLDLEHLADDVERHVAERFMGLHELACKVVPGCTHMAGQRQPKHRGCCGVFRLPGHGHLDVGGLAGVLVLSDQVCGGGVVVVEAVLGLAVQDQLVLGVLDHHLVIAEDHGAPVFQKWVRRHELLCAVG